MPYGHPVPRVHHSFPTRRSSDLAAVTNGAITIDGVRGEDLRSILLGFERLGVRPRLDGTQLIVDAGQERDRKSTRLNSSHSSISYAVFCLKKKKPEWQRRLRGRQ